jgi:hypothetical protein
MEFNPLRLWHGNRCFETLIDISESYTIILIGNEDKTTFWDSSWFNYDTHMCKKNICRMFREVMSTNIKGDEGIFV